MIIYKATNKENNLIYIGQTVMTLEDRNKTRKYGKSKFDLVFNSIGFEGFDWEIIDSASDINELNNKEIFWIKYFDSTNPEKGYNVSKGGGNVHVCNCHNTGSHIYGKYGENIRSKKIIELSTGNIYESGTHARDLLGLKSEFPIYNSCKGRCESYCGYKFRYLDVDGNYIKTKYDDENYSKQDHRVVCLNDMNVFDSCTKANEYYKYDNPRTVSRKCEYNTKSLDKLRIENRDDLVFIYYRDFEKWIDIVSKTPNYDVNEKRRNVAKEKCGKKIRCITDGRVFETIKEASIYYSNLGYRGLSSSQIVNHLKNNSVFRYAKSLKFEYL